jgi:hypothetical protein
MSGKSSLPVDTGDALAVHRIKKSGEQCGEDDGKAMNEERRNLKKEESFLRADSICTVPLQ